MGILNKIKNIFTKSSDVEVYDKGLEKTRHEFVSKLGNLSKKYKFVNDDYFEELEDILIMADIGVNTVLKFVDSLKKELNKKILRILII